MKADNQARLIKAIQTCRRKVSGLDGDDDWRDFLEKAAGGRSLKAMTGPQLGRVLDALHAAGAPRLAPQPAGRSRYAASRQMAMIRGLWLELADLGVVQDRSESALSAFVKRQTRQDFGRLDQQAAERVIEALKSWRARTLAKADGASAS